MTITMQRAAVVVHKPVQWRPELEIVVKTEPVAGLNLRRTCQQAGRAGYTTSPRRSIKRNGPQRAPSRLKLASCPCGLVLSCVSWVVWGPQSRRGGAAAAADSRRLPAGGPRARMDPRKISKFFSCPRPTENQTFHCFARRMATRDSSRQQATRKSWLPIRSCTCRFRSLILYPAIKPAVPLCCRYSIVPRVSPRDRPPRSTSCAAGRTRAGKRGPSSIWTTSHSC